MDCQNTTPSSSVHQHGVTPSFQTMLNPSIGGAIVYEMTRDLDAVAEYEAGCRGHLVHIDIWWVLNGHQWVAMHPSLEHAKRALFLALAEHPEKATGHPGLELAVPEPVPAGVWPAAAIATDANEAGPFVCLAKDKRRTGPRFYGVEVDAIWMLKRLPPIESELAAEEQPVELTGPGEPGDEVGDCEASPCDASGNPAASKGQGRKAKPFWDKIDTKIMDFLVENGVPQSWDGGQAEAKVHIVYPDYSLFSSEIVLGFAGKSKRRKHFNGVDIGIRDEGP